MTNLFSVFDPGSMWALPLNWVSSFCVLAFLPPLFWLSITQAKSLTLKTLNMVHVEFSAILGTKSSPGNTIIVVSLFAFIALNNTLGLSPYAFTASSHLTFSLVMALPLWLGHILFSAFRQPSSMLAHLVPRGTPYPLMPLMVIIEIISNLIRPFTLAVRLAANMVAGHLLLALISGQAPISPAMIIPLIVLGVSLLGILESAVALIQAYVFSVLRTLYLREVDSKAILL